MAKVGQEYNVNLCLDIDPNKINVDFCGKMIVKNFDSEYIKIVEMTWSPGIVGNVCPSIDLSIIPLKIGKTNIEYEFQINKFNPLFIYGKKEILIIE